MSHSVYRKAFTSQEVTWGKQHGGFCSLFRETDGGKKKCKQREKQRESVKEGVFKVLLSNLTHIYDLFVCHFSMKQKRVGVFFWQAIPGFI